MGPHCDIIYKRQKHKWNQHNLVPNLCEIIEKHETFVKPRCAKRLDFSYQTMRLLCETVYKWVNPSWNRYNLVQNLNDTIVKQETYLKPVPNGIISHTKRCTYFAKPSMRVNNKWNKHNLVPNLNETIVKHENLYETSIRQITEFLVPNNVSTHWNRL
jgi:hypothetical protein